MVHSENDFFANASQVIRPAVLQFTDQQHWALRQEANLVTHAPQAKGRSGRVEIGEQSGR